MQFKTVHYTLTTVHFIHCTENEPNIVFLRKIYTLVAAFLGEAKGLSLLAAFFMISSREREF